MKKKLKRFSFKKKLLFSGLGLLILPFLIVGSLLAYVYFSPAQVRNFPIGDRRMQINFTPGGINIFYPRDDTSDYYSHNFSSWQIITGANNKYEEVDFSHKPQIIYPDPTSYTAPTPYPSTVLTKYKYDESAPKGSLVVNIFNNADFSRCNPKQYPNYCLSGPKIIILQGWRIGDDDKIALFTSGAFDKFVRISNGRMTEQIDNITPGEYILEYMYKDPTEKDQAPNVIIKSGETTTIDLDLTKYYH